MRKREDLVKKARNRGLVAIGTIMAIIVAIGSLFLFWHPTGQASNPLFECVGAIDYHIHAHLSYQPHGVLMTIPALVGYRNGCFLPMHTHQTDGIIHIESSQNYRFSIGDFFRVWNVNVTSPYASNVQHCSIAPAGPTFTLNGCGDPFASDLGYVLENGDNVTVIT